MKLKEKFDYIYDNYNRHILWFLLALQAIAVSIYSYNS